MSALTPTKPLDFLKQNAIYFVLLLLLIIIIVQDPSFLSLRNFSNILTQSSVRLIIFFYFCNCTLNTMQILE